MCDIERPPGYDRVRNAEIGNKDFELDVLEEAYTTEHWLVRIYKVSSTCTCTFNSVTHRSFMKMWITVQCSDMANLSNLSNSEPNRSRIWTTVVFPGRKIPHWALRALKAFPCLLLMGVNYFVSSCFKKNICFLILSFSLKMSSWIREGDQVSNQIQVFLKSCKSILKVKWRNKQVLGNVGGIVCVIFTLCKHESQIRWRI